MWSKKKPTKRKKQNKKPQPTKKQELRVLILLNKATILLSVCLQRGFEDEEVMRCL